MSNSYLAKNLGAFSCLIVALAVLAGVICREASAQQPSLQSPGSTAVEGTVVDGANNLISGASVTIERKDRPGTAETKTNQSGAFVFALLQPGTYSVSSEKFGLWTPVETFVLLQGERKRITLVLKTSTAVHANSGTAGAPEAMQFADQPNFTVAGVTDWTAAGGHGSDVKLRTSEDLTREAIVLKPKIPEHGSSGSASSKSVMTQSESSFRDALEKAPKSFEANHQLGELYLHQNRFAEAIPLLLNAYQIDPANYNNEYDLAIASKGAHDFSQAREHLQKLLVLEDNADLHRTLAEIDEDSGDPLTAVHEYEKAVNLDPSEQNYFAWGSELLLHRAVQPAVDVLGRGAKAHPNSSRMLAGLGAALFASGQYNEAAQRLCDASDSSPADVAPYIFLGKIEMAAPSPPACAERKLARLVQQQPENALANYYYAMAIWKSHMPESSGDQQQVEALLTKAVTVDPKFDDAFLQLGILYADKHDFEKAIGFYAKAIAVNPQLSAAHYRLGVAYERIGEPEKATQEFRLHDEIEKEQADTVERERREIKQFLVVLNAKPASSLSK